MATWKVARRSKTCALSGRDLPPDTEILAALFGEPEEVSEDRVRGPGLVRKDFLVEGNDPAALAAATASAYSVWRTRTPPADPAAARRLDLGMARDLLERMVAEGDPARAPVMLTLALLLVRKRQARIVEEKDGLLVLQWPKAEGTFRIPSVVVTEAEEAALEQELARLFEF
jgi:hypothetical protein